MILRGPNVSGKVCRICKEFKPLSELVKNKKYTTGVESRCRPCSAQRKREHYAANADEINAERRANYTPGANRENCKAYYEANKEKFRDYAKRDWAKKDKEAERQRAAKWRADNPEKIRALWKRRDEKRRSTPKGRIESAMSRGINHGLRKGEKSGRRTFAILGYTSDDLVRHLEGRFLPGMTWKNYGKAWEIDHVIPKSAFNYQTTDAIDFKKCWALSNLQPLWKSENRSKRDRISHPFQPSLSLPIPATARLG